MKARRAALNPKTNAEHPNNNEPMTKAAPMTQPESESASLRRAKARGPRLKTRLC